MFDLWRCSKILPITGVLTLLKAIIWQWAVLRDNWKSVRDRMIVLFTNMKLHAGFRLVSKLTTLNDLERAISTVGGGWAFSCLNSTSLHDVLRLWSVPFAVVFVAWQVLSVKGDRRGSYFHNTERSRLQQICLSVKFRMNTICSLRHQVGQSF